ncbi:MAG: sulfatase [Bacteroidales bacterium]|nr:sulfatase [Bacteroidales bacterium]
MKTFFIGAIAFTPFSIQANDPINFILIHLDDMGYGDLSVTGSSGYLTPNIDRLSMEGMRFTHFYSAQAVSSASRAGLLTGCYPNRIGFYGALNPNAKKGLSPAEETIATLLKKKGYVCSAVGKWHLGDAPEFMPLQHGFDEYFGLLYSNDMWPYHPTAKYPPLPLYKDNEVINSDMSPDDQKELTTQYTEQALRFIEENKDKPFFLYLAHSMPHVPLYVSDKFEGKSEQGAYGDVMMELDWSVGEILKVLKKNGLDNQTLIIFTSDNGPWINYGDHAGSTGGLREGKGTSFEGGQRVPCIFRWPGKIPAGTINNNLASSIDILPTIMKISESELPEKKIDGVDIYEMLTGNFELQPRKYFLYYYKENNLEAIRNDKFKLIFEHKGRSYELYPPGNDGKPGRVEENRPVLPGLYDLRRDPGERYDVSELYPEIIMELNRVADEAREDLGDFLRDIPGKNRRPIGVVTN